MTNISAASILQAGLQHMSDRAATYDKPHGERSVPATVEAFNAITGHSLTVEQGWLFMALLKAVRAQSGAYKSDNYEDFAAYAGLMGEAAFFERALKPAKILTDEERQALQAAMWPEEAEARMDVIGTNGNDGLHYDLPNTDALVDPTGKPKWGDAPIWANYLTQDAAGVWTFWQKEPRPFAKRWICDDAGLRAEVNSGKVAGNWRETLEPAPGLLNTEAKA